MFAEPGPQAGRSFVFLDRDGTLLVDVGYGHRSEDYAELPGVVGAVRRLQSANFGVVVVSNQSGIGRGRFGEADLERYDAHFRARFSARGIDFDGIYYCPHEPAAQCRCRKPSPGLVEQALQEHAIDLRASFVIGDKASDVELAAVVGCHGVLVLTGQGREQRPRVGDDVPVAADLSAAVDCILERSKGRNR